MKTLNKERAYEISIFQTGKARPKGTSAQLLLVLTTFVVCLFITMVFIEDEQIVQDNIIFRADQNNQ